MRTAPRPGGMPPSTRSLPQRHLHCACETALPSRSLETMEGLRASHFDPIPKTADRAQSHMTGVIHH